MAKAYYLSVNGGENFEAEALLTTADITLVTNEVANSFFSLKDSADNIYIMCMFTTNYNTDTKLKIIKITSLGIKTSATVNWRYSGFYDSRLSPMFVLSRDEQTIFAFINNSGSTAQGNLYSLSTIFTDGGYITTSTVLVLNTNSLKFAIYQDRYIWTASDTTVSIYDYATKALIDSETTTATVNYGMCVSVDNTCYLLYYTGSSIVLVKFVLNDNTITKTTVAVPNDAINAKQMVIDKWGDLVILTNSGTASHLLKYTTAGLLIQDLNLSVAEILGVGRVAFSLNVYSTKNLNGTLKDCQVSVENDLIFLLSEPVTSQGQSFGHFTRELMTGNTTYNNDNGGDNNLSVRA